MIKPIVRLWSLGELKPQRMLAKALSKSEVDSFSVESEARLYQVATKLAGETPTGAVLTYGAVQTITPKLKSILLMASCYVSEIVVLLVGCDEIKTEKAIDSIESNLRRNLSEQGFDGNAATILRVKEGVSQSDVKELLRVLDEATLTIAPRAAPSALPKDHPNEDLVKVLLILRELARPAKQLTIERAFQEKPAVLDTQFGGNPYTEAKDKWPRCACRGKPEMQFLWQINAAQDLTPPLEGAGLYTFYTCLEETGRHEPFSVMKIKHYPSPSKEKLSTIKNENTGDLRTMSATTLSEVPSMFNIQAEKQHKTLLSKMKKAAGKKAIKVFFAEALQMLGVSESSFDAEQIQEDEDEYDERAGRIWIGGYSPLFESGEPMPPCEACKKPLRSLLNVGHQPDYGFFDGSAADLQFFVCGCDVSKVISRVITQDDDFSMFMRYNVSME